MVVSIAFSGADKMIKKLSRTFVDPVKQRFITNLTHAFERDVKKATVWDTGRAKTSIISDIRPMVGTVSTNVKYYPYIEYGTEKMEARHMEGGAKILGEGAFHYVAAKFNKTAKEVADGIAASIEADWRR